MLSMQENQLREVVGNSLPKIITAAAKGIYPLEFQPRALSPIAFKVDLPIAATQLAYTANWQALSFLLMDSAHILKLGLRAFPKKQRQDLPRIVMSANCEILNSASAKLGFLLGKLDSTSEVSLTPPLPGNFTGENARDIACRDSIFLTLGFEDSSLTFITTLQMT